MAEVSLCPLDRVDAAELEALSHAVFADEQPSERLAEVLAAEAHAADRRGSVADPSAFGVAAVRGSTLIGWTQGYRVGTSLFHMLNSGVAPAERRHGVYSQLVRAVLAHAESQGYVAVRSLHRAGNTAVIIAKLRLGFQIAGFEYSEVYGPLVQLRYLIGDARRRLYAERAAAIRPAQT